MSSQYAALFELCIVTLFDEQVELVEPTFKPKRLEADVSAVHRIHGETITAVEGRDLTESGT
jgi:hypothetical protein